MASMVSTITREYLDALPDDGLRHELIDGTLVMTPAPGTDHQRIVGGLYVALRDALRGTEYEVLMAPLDVVIGTSIVEPDLLVAPRDAFTERGLPVAPLLVVEVQSPSTAWIDEGRKKEIYEESGVRHYWLADPSEPSLTLLDLIDSAYVQSAQVTGGDVLEIERPVPMRLVPSELACG